LKFSDRYTSNIKQVVNVNTCKLNGLKSHDYHIIIERLMPVMFHGYFNADLWKIFTKLSYFYRQICTKQVSKVMMQKLEKEIVVLLCKMEKNIPAWMVQCDATFVSAFTLGSQGWRTYVVPVDV
jgi:hypothetical protein